MSAAPPAPEPVAPAEAAPEAGLLAQLRATWDELLAVLQAQLELAALEARQALGRLVLMLALALLCAALLATVWLGLVGAGVLLLIERGMSGPAALLLASGASVVAIVVCVVVLRSMARHMPFAGTLRSLHRPK
jgi:hypothetical protein